MKVYQRDDLVVIRGTKAEQWIARIYDGGVEYRIGIDTGEFSAFALANFIGASPKEVQSVIDTIKTTGKAPVEQDS